MTAAASAPWLANLSPESVEAVRAAVAEAPPLTADQKACIAAILRAGATA